MLESFLGSSWQNHSLPFAFANGLPIILLHFAFLLFFIQFSRYSGQIGLRTICPVVGSRWPCPFEPLSSPVLCRSCASLSLCHFRGVVGSNGLEPSTSRLSGVRSNHLSYEPISVAVSSCHSRPTCCCAVLFASQVPTCRSYSLQRVLPPAQLVVEMNRIELSTPCLQGRCSPN